MKRVGSLLLLFLSGLLLANRAHAADDRIPYPRSAVEAQSARLSGRIREMHDLLHNNVLNEAERRALVGIQVRTPVVGMGETAIEFYSNTQSREVFLPLSSLMLIEDLCTAYAWLQVKRYEHSTIDEYLAMIRYREPGDFPGGRFPGPLKALGIPDDALEDPGVDALSLRLRNNAWAFILLHELGHLRHGHVSRDGDSTSAAQRREIEADEFALEVMKRDDAVPVGAFLFWQASVHYFMNRGDFDSDAQWRRYMNHASTHPVNAGRARFVAGFLKEHAAGFADGPDAMPVQRELALEIAEKMEIVVKSLEDTDRQRGARELARITSPATLKPRPVD